MAGVFSSWQPLYAELGIATFPVREKQPAVRGYLKLGLRASGQLAVKFPNHDAFGLACRRNNITVLDIDAPDERLLADALSDFGPTPFIVRSGSGNYQAWYRHNGEKRHVRPDATRPIDILGDGYVVAPPSAAAKGPYSIIQGSLDDLSRLPVMRRSEPATGSCPDAVPAEKIDTGRRNQGLWRACMTHARRCHDIAELMKAAVEMNQTMFYEPLPDDEVLRIVASAWAKESCGQNWFGRCGVVAFDAHEIDNLLTADSDGFLLLTVLRRYHRPGEQFAIANGMHTLMGWRRQRFTDTRARLERRGLIREVRPYTPRSAAVYELRVSRNGQ